MTQAPIYRRLRSLCLLLCALAATGAAWWDGLDVDPEVYSGDWVLDGKLYEYTAQGCFMTEADRLHQDLEHVPVEDLLSRCEAVIAAGLAAEKKREQTEYASKRGVPQSWYGGPRVRAWLLCMVAVKRMGESEDQKWVPVLERLHEKWQAATGAGVRVGSGRALDLFLSDETGDAYRKLSLRDVGLAELAVKLRQTFAEDSKSSSRLRRRAAHDQRMELARKGAWAPEFRSLWTDPDPDIRKRMVAAYPPQYIAPEEHPLYVSLLDDPEPYVQRRVWGALTAIQYLGLPFIPALVEFLERDDIDERTRRLAEDGIRVRGHAVKRTAEGIVLEADKNESLRAHLEWLTDSEIPWRRPSMARLRHGLRPERSFPLVLHFLAREDIDDNAREAATRLLSERGYAPATGPGGCLIAVPEDGGPPILQKDCRPQDEP